MTLNFNNVVKVDKTESETDKKPAKASKTNDKPSSDAYYKTIAAYDSMTAAQDEIAALTIEIEQCGEIVAGAAAALKAKKIPAAFKTVLETQKADAESRQTAARDRIQSLRDGIGKANDDIKAYAMLFDESKKVAFAAKAAAIDQLRDKVAKLEKEIAAAIESMESDAEKAETVLNTIVKPLLETKP